MFHNHNISRRLQAARRGAAGRGAAGAATLPQSRQQRVQHDIITAVFTTNTNYYGLTRHKLSILHV